MATFGTMSSELWSWVLSVPLFVYVISMVVLRRKFTIRSAGRTSTPISLTLVIPFRNEGSHILSLLEDLESMDTQGSIEVIWVNDGSTDAGPTLLENALREAQLDHHILNLSPLGKKAALDAGIRMAKGNWIHTTDADCRIPSSWVSDLEESIGRNPERWVWCGPVLFQCHTFWQWMQSLDFLSLVASTRSLVNMGYPIMANGANLAFRKETYLELAGDLANKDHPGGDDTFLVQQVAMIDPGRVGFLDTEQAVVTQAPRGLKEWWNQRIRWASKTPMYSYGPAKWVALLVLLANLTPWVILGFNPYMALGWVVVKLVGEAWFLSRPISYFDRRDLWVVFIPQGLFNFFYVPVIALFSLFAPFRWK